MKTFYLISYFICWVMIGAVVASPALMTGVSEREANLTVLFGAIVGMVVAHFTRRWRIFHWMLICLGPIAPIFGFIGLAYLKAADRAPQGPLSGVGEVILAFILFYIALIALFALGAGIFGRLADGTKNDT